MIEENTIYNEPCLTTDGRFKKGQHWRSHKPHWDKEWLTEMYIIRKISIPDIAKMSNCTDSNISYWMGKHGIIGRTISEARKIKRWGLFGEDNPMYNKRGILNANWKGGISPERNAFYSSIEWKSIVPVIFKKYNYKCVRCGQGHADKSHKLHIHHLVSFSCKELRCDENNLVLLCKSCHDFVHSNKNTDNEYILTYEQLYKI